MPLKAPQLVLCRNESVSAGLRRIVDELIKRAIACIRQPSTDREEDLHQVRLAIKKLRAILRLLRPLVSKTFFKRENARLRSAARRLARLRDFAVARRTLEQVTDKLASHSQDAAVQEVFEAFLAQTPASWEDWQSCAKVRGNLARGASARSPSAVGSEILHRPSAQAAAG